MQICIFLKSKIELIYHFEYFRYNLIYMELLTLDQLSQVVEYAEARAVSDYIQAAPGDLRELLGMRVEHVGRATLVITPGLDDLFYNRVIGLGVGEEATEEQVDQIIQIFSDAEVGQFYFHLSPGARPEYLWEWLERRGFYPNGSWVKLIRDTSPPPFIETTLQIEPISSEYADAFAAIGVEAFGLPEILFPMLANTVERPDWRHFLAFDGDYPAAGGAMHVHKDVAWLGFMGTRESHQKRGAQSAMATRRIFEAAQAGCKWVVSDTFEHSEDQPNRSLLNLQRLGFEIAYWRVNFLNL